MQTKLGSLWEAFVNIFIGYSINLLGQIDIFPMFGVYLAVWDNLRIGALFTIISIARSYFIRRFFNKKGVMNATVT